ncbi:MAG TPA: response regulator [Thermosynechococcaceae cyanobacterium]
MQQISSLRGIQVLVVDNDRAIREAVSFILQELGAEVLSAATVPQALALFTHSRPNVLISDINMPGEDGYSLLRQLKAMESQDSQTASIAMTASSQKDDRQRLLAAGFQRVLLKPFSRSDLIEAIVSLLSLD